MTTSVQFIEGLNEEISGISLRKRKNSTTKIFVLLFERLQALERLRAYRNQITHLWLTDEEGQIKIEPTGIKFFYRDDDELTKVECTFEVDSDDIFERIMQFLNRYAEENGFEFQPTES